MSAEVAGHGSVYCENGNTRNTKKLFSRRRVTVLQKLFVSREEGLGSEIWYADYHSTGQFPVSIFEQR